MKLKGKTAIVTGAAMGLGRGMAVRLAKEGCDLTVCDIEKERLGETADIIRGLGRKCLAAATDVSSGPEAEKAVNMTAEEFGGIDILVNNAGIITVGHITSLTEEDWDRTMAVNLKGAFLFTRFAAPFMIRRKSGRIINMSSKSGKQGGLWLSAYCASKFAMIGLTQSSALDLAEHNITVNAICPGMVLTPAWSKLITAYAKKLGIDEDAVIPYYRGKIPLGREAAEDDVGNVLVFLCSDEAGYMTGQAVNVTGGQEMR